MKILLVIVCIAFALILWACCKVSGDISREEEAKELEKNKYHLED